MIIDNNNRRDLIRMNRYKFELNDCNNVYDYDGDCNYCDDNNCTNGECVGDK